ncbi:MAG: phosphoglycerate dehydrogenase [Planctomycetes bacterium]|nr:phosphoglycerate dehydrogenase [Planctomycetota bacterium]
MKILVTPRSVTKNGHPSLDALKKAGYGIVLSTPGQFPTEEELLALLPGCAGYLAGVETISARVLESASDLKVISRNGTGVDSVDMDAAQKCGVKVCRAQGANARGVAELTLAHILATVRSLPFSDHQMKNGQWQRRKGIELEARTLGLLGCGKIGQLVAGFALAFGMQVKAYDPYPDPTFSPSDAFAYGSLDEVLSESDILSLHCPAQAGNVPLIDSQALSSMKKGVTIVNTARGSLLDEAAVLAALDSGHVAGVTLDAFESEPPQDWALARDPRVVSSPHIGGFTKESVDRAMCAAVDNLLAALLEC